MNAILQRAALPTGVRLEYVTQGDTSATPVIFLHGITDSWHSWEPVLGHLPPTLRAFALSLRGHGGSDRPASGYTPADFADDLARFLDSVQVERAVIVGHSMGTYVAQRIAVDRPDRVAALVLVGAFHPRTGHPTMQALWDEGFAGLADPIDPRFVRAFQRSTVVRPIPPQFLDLAVAESLRAPARVWRESLLGMRDHGFAGEISRIQAPTCLVWGDRDEIAGRADQTALLAAIPTAMLVTFEETGHGVHWDRPERFAATLVEFVGNLRARDPDR